MIVYCCCNAEIMQDGISVGGCLRNYLLHPFFLSIISIYITILFTFINTIPFKPAKGKQHLYFLRVPITQLSACPLSLFPFNPCLRGLLCLILFRPNAYRPPGEFSARLHAERTRVAGYVVVSGVCPARN